MATLSDIRAKYPEYNYLSDPELADALHKKFYADVPRADFDKRVGLQAATEPVSAGEMVSDVAKSAGIGLVQGGLGLATLPGNIEALGRAGINAGAGLVGVKPPVDSDTFLTNYNDAKKRVEGYTGEFYEPKTTAGKYARTIGEFAPGAIGGGSLAARAARVALPAVTSETAGQMAEGTAYEPVARVAGALAASRIPGVAGRIATPAPADPGRAAAVQSLEQSGVNALTAGQRTGNERVRWIEDATAMVPGGGGRATAMQQEAAQQFTSAALARAGIQADRATGPVMDQAFNAIGREYNNFGNGVVIAQSPSFERRLNDIVTRYQRNTPATMRRDMIGGLANDVITATRSQTGLLGQQLMRYRSELRQAQRSLKSDPDAARAVGEMVDAFDRQLVRSQPSVAQRAATATQLRDLNTRYRNMLAIEDAASGAGEGATAGLISPALLRTAIKKANKREYVRGRHPMADLARSGAAVLQPLRSSGTAERSFAQGVVSSPASMLSGMAGGVASGGDLVTMGLAATAPTLARAATARGIMSRPAQRYLGNQMVPRQLEPIDNRNALLMLPFMSTRED
jgi:beta-phosphoglucomutase-like phosphatase (HAD superfamily)